jgi:ADP-ribosyl-[dinitrogen reductase] hydrolase
MRLAPVVIRHWSQTEERRRIIALQSQTTHGAEEAINACVFFADVLAETIQGKDGRSTHRRVANTYPGQIGEIATGRWRGRPRGQIRGSGYVVHSLEAALWCVGRTSSFKDAVLLAANLREDADTTAAITGQLAGALYGASHIPEDWLAKLAWRDRIENTARRLFRMSQVRDEAKQARPKV